MDQTFTPTDGASGTELISLVSAGDTHAYGVLFGCHRDATRRMARQIPRSSDVDDLLAESFARVLVKLQNEDGPDEAFRARAVLRQAYL